MTFSEGGSFEGGRVRSRRGGAVAAGGGVGVLGIVGFLIYQFTGVDVTPALEGAAGGGQEQTDVVGDCTAEQANTDQRCRLSATVQSLDAYWDEVFTAAGAELVLPDVTEFSGSTATRCGQATASTGPFYCPPDQGIYLDLSFYEVLEREFGASGGPLAELYVTAHEYGHHVQNVTGVMSSTDRSQVGSGSGQVRLELQADCYAGLWLGAAATTDDPDTGVPFLEPVTQEQLAQALSAAEAVGDDHIQEASGGAVNPHTWTHGSSEQRQRWFTVGYEQGADTQAAPSQADVAACDTFGEADV